jgi:hypothetical protein
MSAVITLEGAGDRGHCKCTKRGRTLCRVGKTKKHPTGWTFVSRRDSRSKACGR